MPPPITMRAFVDGLEAITVVGVVRGYDQGSPSGATSTADLPAMFIYQPRIDGATRKVFGSQGGGGSLRAQLIILVEPVAQSVQGENFDDAVGFVDALETELKGAPCTIGGVLSWSIRIGEFALTKQTYWAVIADIQGGRW